MIPDQWEGTIRLRIPPDVDADTLSKSVASLIVCIERYLEAHGVTDECQVYVIEGGSEILIHLPVHGDRKFLDESLEQIRIAIEGSNFQGSLDASKKRWPWWKPWRRWGLRG